VGASFLGWLIWKIVDDLRPGRWMVWVLMAAFLAVLWGS
jgi:hypothetical protein